MRYPPNYSPQETQFSFGMSGGQAGVSCHVGDVNSTAKGSGARYNAGKVPLELIPFGILAMTAECESVQKVLSNLGQFQFKHDPRFIEACIYDLRDYITECARVFDYGRHKYAEWNWIKGMKWSIPLACAGRHLLAIDSGEEIDPESGLLHWGHVLCNLTMLSLYSETYPEGNDLPTLPEHDNDPE
jgi:hypothetical protein